MKKFMFHFILIGMLVLLFGISANAKMEIPKTISLIENTTLYNSPSEYDESGAALSPQDVTVLDAEKDWYKYFGEQKVWIKIKTVWLGDQWIHIHANAIGTIIAKNNQAFVSGSIALYNTPFRSDYSGTTLPRQNITIKAWFDRPRGEGLRSYLIESPIGEKWFMPYDEYILEPIEETNLDISFTTTGSIFESPLNYYSSKHFTPQTFRAFEKYKDYYHVKTANGEKFWVNKLFVQPDKTEQVNSFITLTDKTQLFEYPNDQSYMSAVLAPQQVTAKEKYMDGWGNSWYKIETYAGDVWILYNKDGSVNPKGNQDPDGYLQVLFQEVSFEDSIAHISGRVKLIKNINTRFDESLDFNFQMLDENGNVIGEGQRKIGNIRYGEELSFYATLDITAPIPKDYSFKILPVSYLSES
jgi:hypothetical protein